MEKNNKETIEFDKSKVTCDIGTAQCEDEIIKCENNNNNNNNNEEICRQCNLYPYNLGPRSPMMPKL